MDAEPVSIGIDLGTTNSVAAYWNGREAQVLGQGENGGMLPSVFGWQKPSEAGLPDEYLVGLPAVRNWQAAPQDTVFCVKRLMGRSYYDEHVVRTRKAFPFRLVEGENGGMSIQVGGQSFTPVDISATLKLRAERELRRPVDAAVITVPAYFEERQRKATREAGAKAGLRVRKIIDEPTAAAIAFGIHSEERQTLMVFDLGGGTFDLSILRVVRRSDTRDPVFHVEQIDGDNWLGGADFDERVIDHIAADFLLRGWPDPRSDPEFLALMRKEVEERKIDLSAADQVQITKPAAYRDDSGVYSVNLALTLAKFEELIVPDVQRAMDIVRRALQSRSFTTDSLTGVLLVGGSTKVPLVRRRLEELVGREKIRKDINPMTVVAQGAAILAGRLRGVECPNPDCGGQKRRKIRILSTGQEKEVIEHYVNPESNETCEKCGASLASARAATETLQIHERTARSLGILAVQGDRKNAYVCLIPKNSPYPLITPVSETFFPHAMSANMIRVPVFEAEDDVGSNRVKQGEIECPLGESIAANTPVNVELNMDRNRVVRIVVRVENRQFTGELTWEPPLDEPQTAHQPASWIVVLDNRIHMVRILLDRYGGFMEPLRAARIREHLERARAAQDMADVDQRPTREVERVIGLLDSDLVESGSATLLYWADLVKERATPDAQQQIQSCQQNLQRAVRSNDSDAVHKQTDELKTLLVRQGSGTRKPDPQEEYEFDPKVLLEKRGSVK